MASYCTQADLIEKLPETDLVSLSNDTEAAIINSARVNNLISENSDLIDSYLRGSYTLPLSEVPTLLKTICCYLVIYALYVRRFGGDPEGIPQAIQENNKQARADLERIQKGIIVLDVGDDTDTPGANLFLTDGAGPVEFDSDTMDLF